MTRTTFVTLALLLPACIVEDLELDTEGEASTSDTDDPSVGQTATSGTPSTQNDDPQGWATMMATQRCAAFERCDCFDEAWSWSDPEACFEDNYAFYWMRAEWGELLGAELSPSCLEAHVDTLLEGSCDDTVPPLAGVAILDAAACKLFVGDGEVGDSCAGRGDLVSRDDTCREGLVCFAGACAVPLDEGDACDDGTGACALPQVCIGGVCVTQGDVGDPCSADTCAAGLVCEGSCVAAGGAGAACEGAPDCASLRCVDLQCEAPAAALCGPYAWEVPG